MSFYLGEKSSEFYELRINILQPLPHIFILVENSWKSEISREM